MKRALLLLNGDPPSQALLQQEAALAEFVLAADGAAAWAVALGVTPQAVLGDFDSLDLQAPNLFPLPRIPKPDQAASDGEKALLHLQSQGFDEVVMLGGLGGRQDHFLYHCHLLALPQLKNMKLTLRGEAESIVLLRGTCQLAGWPGRRISLLPLFGETRVIATGLQWPLQGQPLAMGLACSLSNQITGLQAEISSLPFPLLVVLEERPL